MVILMLCDNIASLTLGQEIYQSVESHPNTIRCELTQIDMDTVHALHTKIL
jgi:hypothetical protein